MDPPRVVFVVGHEHWGKSQTLRQLTGGDSHKRRTTISGAEFFLRRTSNDDDPDGFVEFIRRIEPSATKQLIAALCANFERNDARTQFILETLRSKGYTMYFFVLEHCYGRDTVVTRDQIARLRRFGNVEIYSQRGEAEARARALRAFVSNAVLA
jgi:hypothetical protein